MSETIAFTKVRLPGGWLGNMSPHPVEHEGHRYPTAEALFQALRFDSTIARAEIRAQRSPMAAKMTAKRMAKRMAERMTVEPRSAADLDNMRLVVRLKIEQHPDLRRMLLETGDAAIVEDCSARPRGSGLFWGAKKNPDGTWTGENWLGRIWMELRSELDARS